MMFGTVLFLLSLASPTSTLCVGVYDGPGAFPSRRNLVEMLRESPQLQVHDLTPAMCQADALTTFHVVLFPGGTAAEQAKALGESGRQNLRQFVQNGGGYVGICAGAYLATESYDWSLRLLAARVVDRDNWNRGTGSADVGLTPAGTRLFGLTGVHSMCYWQGPLLAPTLPRRTLVNDSLSEPATTFESLAVYRSEVRRPDSSARVGVMLNTTAIAAGQCGQGRVLLFSPHPEATERMEWLLIRGTIWTAGRTRSELR
jgi:glutamine amidotransferase PdxT